MREFTKAEMAFINASKAMEKRTARVSAYVILHAGKYVGRVVISYPADGANRVYAIAWLPGNPDSADRWVRHYGWASGGGYDKKSAAMSGAAVWNPVTGKMVKIPDDGQGWENHLRHMDYEIITAV
jgi:hypothetical protein